MLFQIVFIIMNLIPSYSFNIITSRTYRRSLPNNKLLLANTNYQNQNITSKILLNESNQYLINDIYFNGQINDENCFQLSQALNQCKNLVLSNQHCPNHINLYIQSPGGSLLPALALVDEIINYEIDIHTYVRGYTASAATLLSVVGKKRFISKHSLMMIHGVKLNERPVSTVLDIKDLDYNIDLFMSIISDIYLENSNIDKKILLDLFDHDIWINASKALEFGLVDEIL